MAYYAPGNEPYHIQEKLSSFFEQVNEAYPDKKIKKFHNSHKRLGHYLTSLYRELGYQSGQEMMEAYGYEYDGITGKERKPKRNKTEVLNALKSRYPSCPSISTVSQLKIDNPDIAHEICLFSKTELIAAGILENSNVVKRRRQEELSKKIDELFNRILELIKEKYPQG